MNLEFVWVDAGKDLLDLLVCRLVLVAVGDEEFGSEEGGNIVDFHIFGLFTKEITISFCDLSRHRLTNPGLEMGERNGNAVGLLASLMHDELNLLLDELAEEESEEFCVIRRFVYVFSETLHSAKVQALRTHR